LTNAGIDADAVQKRIEHARALAAAHQLTAAASELETIHASVKDDVVRNITAVVLLGIYLEDGNYARSASLLEETFKGRSARNEASVRTYFALAGQAINGARAHLVRYRTFGIDVSSPALPAEATGDLDLLRLFLERLTAQAKELITEDARDNDAFALLEDVAGIRLSLARDNDDRARWQTEYSAARAKLATLPMQLASTAGIPPLPLGASVSANGAGQRSGNAPAAEDKKGDSSAGTLAASEPASGAGLQTTAAVAVTDAARAVGGAGPVEVGSLLAKATKQVKPPFPELAKNSGVSGLVRVKVAVDESGSVTSILWVEGPVVLRQAAVDAVRQWKFAPMIVDGKQVRMAGYIDFGFSR
jgi:TonB family protein